jgi:hypothetical protein
MDMINYKRKEHLSASSASKFSRCPRYYFYDSGCRLTKGESDIALKFGSAIHAALPLAYDNISIAFEAFKQVWGDRDNLGDDKRNSFRAMAMITDFFKHHCGNHIYSPHPITQPTEFDLAERNSSAEAPFAFDIDRPFVVVGRIDNAARHNSTGKLFCVEYKTTSELSQRFLQSFESNIQIFTYALAMNIMGDEEFSGVILDALRVSSKNVETVSYVIFVPPYQHERTIKWYQDIADDIIKCEEKQDFPCNWSACSPYGQHACNGYMCKYKDLCECEDFTDLIPAYEITEEKPFIIQKNGIQEELK